MTVPNLTSFSLTLFMILILKNVQIISFPSELRYTTDTATYIINSFHKLGVDLYRQRSIFGAYL